MKYKKIKTGFGSQSDAAIIKLGADIKIGMTNNPFFPTLVTQVDEFITSYVEFVAAIPARQLRNQVATAAKDAKREAFDQILFRLAFGVMSIAYGNDEAIESSGFATTSTDTHHKPIPSRPSNVEAIIATQPNTIQATCDHNKNANIYEAQVHSTDGVLLGSNSETGTKVLVSGITPGILVSVTMRLKNAAGEGNWSAPVLTRIPLPNEPRVKFM